MKEKEVVLEEKKGPTKADKMLTSKEFVIRNLTIHLLVRLIIISILTYSVKAKDTTCYGPITVQGDTSMPPLNCFDNAHIVGHDITCESGVHSSEACAKTCYEQDNCKGFDYSSNADRCCTSSVSRTETNDFHKNEGDYLS